MIVRDVVHTLYPFQQKKQSENRLSYMKVEINTINNDKMILLVKELLKIEN
ncbi:MULTISPECIES: hypothetical protein [Bacillus]|uniref:hypothetical protein n=1 Tax=Bacillus TaxID=1386 RepID=UPI0012B68B8C|nr:MULTISPECIES: hypothetical protein [Bacillus]